MCPEQECMFILPHVDGFAVHHTFVIVHFTDPSTCCWFIAGAYQRMLVLRNLGIHKVLEEMKGKFSCDIEAR